jgi:hypothetical protein
MVGFSDGGVAGVQRAPLVDCCTHGKLPSLITIGLPPSAGSLLASSTAPSFPLAASSTVGNLLRDVESVGMIFLFCFSGMIPPASSRSLLLPAPPHLPQFLAIRSLPPHVVDQVRYIWLTPFVPSNFCTQISDRSLENQIPTIRRALHSYAHQRSITHRNWHPWGVLICRSLNIAILQADFPPVIHGFRFCDQTRYPLSSSTTTSHSAMGTCIGFCSSPSFEWSSFFLAIRPGTVINSNFTFSPPFLFLARHLRSSPSTLRPPTPERSLHSNGGHPTRKFYAVHQQHQFFYMNTVSSLLPTQSTRPTKIVAPRSSSTVPSDSYYFLVQSPAIYLPLTPVIGHVIGSSSIHHLQARTAFLPPLNPATLLANSDGMTSCPCTMFSVGLVARSAYSEPPSLPVRGSTTATLHGRIQDPTSQKTSATTLKPSPANLSLCSSSPDPFRLNMPPLRIQFSFSNTRLPSSNYLSRRHRRRLTINVKIIKPRLGR